MLDPWTKLLSDVDAGVPAFHQKLVIDDAHPIRTLVHFIITYRTSTSCWSTIPQTQTEGEQNQKQTGKKKPLMWEKK